MREVLSFEVMLARAATPAQQKRRGEMILDEVLQIKVRKENSRVIEYNPTLMNWNCARKYWDNMYNNFKTFPTWLNKPELLLQENEVNVISRRHASTLHVLICVQYRPYHNHSESCVFSVSKPSSLLRSAIQASLRTYKKALLLPSSLMYQHWADWNCD